MGVEGCMNGSCKDGSVREWKKGWPLESGGFATLCNDCGSAYNNSVFCDKFHHHQTGWRECTYCNKPIHCGCIVSKSLFKYLNFGGIGCVTCVEASQLPLIRDTENTGFVRSIKINTSDRQTKQIDGLLVDSDGEGNPMQLCRIVEASKSSHWPLAQRDGLHSCTVPYRQEDTRFWNVMKPSSHPLTFSALENNRPTPTWDTKSMQESLSLKISLGSSSGNCVLPSASEIGGGRFEGKASPPFQQEQRSQPILAKPSKTGITMNLETNKGMNSHERIARPPVDGRGKNLLPSRYWPRITDQELEQLSRDLKSTIVPLFEKELSASDAGRIGRLVLPKSCAEAYFPTISQSEGLPLQILDEKGNEWTFQFRFWPNNNSRMYVLEGVTPCIQSLQLNAGDIGEMVFGRIDQGGKFVMGFRRASNSLDTQDASTSTHSTDISTKETTFSGVTENLHLGSSYPDLLQSRKGNDEPHLSGHSEHLQLGVGTADWHQTEHSETVNNDLMQRSITVSEKKGTRNIGPKSKRLLIHNKDAMELKLTWEEAQDFLCPPPSVQPSFVTVEDHIFEEYDEPPVFGRRTIFNAHSSGYCGRSLCSASKMGLEELENFLGTTEDQKKQRIVEQTESVRELEPPGLDALASAATDDLVDPADSSAGVTTKHPRHRPGCTCIVCIQPPSGKGRHKPTCTCVACMTVRRRFNTFMMRKKKREADANQEDRIRYKDENESQTDAHDIARNDTSHLEKEESLNRGCVEVNEPSAAGQIDLNCHPNPEDMEVDVDTAEASMGSHMGQDD
ncbi:hypothetical protein RJT34_11647 [Clitoria ternatea]|uniref:TF-B3 domain-containing protein n=1 Tax=Clitoria ternatea TaxID=43366 RepID=A0AAN9JMF4_CLITE